MSTRRVLGSLLFVALSLPATLAAQAFEGKVTWGMEGEDANMDLTYYLKGADKMRMDMGDQGFMVFNGDSRIMVMPSQRMWMDLAEMEAMAARMGMPPGSGRDQAQEGIPDLVETGETGTFTGIECTYYRYTDEDGDTEICAATGLGWFTGPQSPSESEGMGSSPVGMTAEELQELQSRFPDGFFPLEMRQMQEGAVVMRMWARELSQESLSDDLFPTRGPEGYQKMSMGGIG